MFVERLADTAVLLQLQRAMLNLGAWNLVISIFTLSALVLLIDYARILYLHFKMVRNIPDAREFSSDVY